MKNVFPNVLHYFDYPHVVKLLRNSLLNRNLQRNGVEFSLRMLLPYGEQLKLKLEDIIPTDKMCLQNVLNLTNVIQIILIFYLIHKYYLPPLLIGCK